MPGVRWLPDEEGLLIHRRLLLALTALLLAGCTANAVPALSPTAGPDESVARITFRGGSQAYISQAELERLSTTLYGSPEQPAPADLVLDELITRQLLLRRARAVDIAPDVQRLEQTIENVRSNPQVCGARVGPLPASATMADQRAYWDACAQAFGFENGFAFQNFIAEELTIDAVARAEAPKDMIRAAHILVENAEQANQIYARLCGGEGPETSPTERRCRGANFAALARQYSIEPGAQQSGGELPPFNEQGLTDQGQPFDQTFVSNTWQLRPIFEAGQEAISRPFQTEFGWHIVRILELVASQQSAFEYRNRVLELARSSSVEDLQQPYSAERPLIGVVEILRPLPEQPVDATPEPVIPIPTPTAVPTDELPVEATPGPEETPTP